MAKSKFINPLFQRTEAPVHPPGVSPPSPAGPAEGGGSGVEAPPQHVGPAGTREDAPALEPSSEAPVKFTFYFTPEQLRRLDNLWVRVKLDHRQRLNKSEFVRLALDRLLEDFEQNPQGVLEALRRQRV